MSLLVFEVILFSLLSVLLSLYLAQTRNVYKIWVEKIVYKNEINSSDKNEINSSDKNVLCSNIESFSREICGLVEVIYLLLISHAFVYVIIFIVIIWDSNLLLEPLENIIYVGTLIVASLLFCIVYCVFKKLKINLWDPEKSSSIEEKIFDVWYKYKCHNCKHKKYQKNLKPLQIYKTYAKRIEAKKIQCSKEEFELLKTLFKDEDSVNSQS